MIKRRILCTVIVLCLLFAVGSADQEKMDAAQINTSVEDLAAEAAKEDVWNGKETAQAEEGAEGGPDAEQTGTDVESGGETEPTAADAVYLYKGSARLAQMVEEQSEALEGYASLLQEYELPRQDSGSGQEPGFALLYLDSDDVPELVVMEGKAHAQGASVFMFRDGKVIALGTYGQYGAMPYREKEGLLFDDYDTLGNLHFGVYQIEENHSALLQSYDYWAGLPEGGEEAAYWVDGKEVTEEQYRAVSDKWDAGGYQMIQYDDCRKLPGTDIPKSLREELEDRILMREEVLKQNLLTTAGAQESDILLFDYDDFDGDGKQEAFMIAGESFIQPGGWGDETWYKGTLYFAGADGGTQTLDNSFGVYRMIDGVMDFGSRKYLFFYTDYCVTADLSEIWTVRDGKPVEESDLFQHGQVVYRGDNERDELEIWVDAYDIFCEKEDSGKDDLWTGHSYKPYFYHYDAVSDQLEPYAGEEITPEEFKELSKTNIIEEIEAEGYTVGKIIHWGNDIVTINYHYVELRCEDESRETYVYENVIWDNRAGDYWRKDERGVTSWENAGEWGSYGIPRRGAIG